VLCSVAKLYLFTLTYNMYHSRHC